MSRIAGEIWLQYASTTITKWGGGGGGGGGGGAGALTGGGTLTYNTHTHIHAHRGTRNHKKFIAETIFQWPGLTNYLAQYVGKGRRKVHPMKKV